MGGGSKKYINVIGISPKDAHRMNHRSRSKLFKQDEEDNANVETFREHCDTE